MLAIVRREKGRSVVLIMRPGSTPRRLATFLGHPAGAEALVSIPVWSPAGRELAIAIGGSALAHRSAAIVTISVATGRIRTVLSRRAFRALVPDSLAWLPDGRLAFCDGWEGPGYTLDTRSGRLRRYGRARCGDFGPVWSPDGSRYLVVRGDRRGNGQIEMVDRKGRRVRLTNDIPSDPELRFSYVAPAWSPDGRKIAFLAGLRESWNFDVFVMKADGSERRRLTWNAHVERSTHALAFSTDGRLVAFVNHGTRLHVVSASGGSPQLVVRRIFDSSWRPQAGHAFAAGPWPIGRPPLRVVSFRRRDYPWYPGRFAAVRPIARVATTLAGSRDGALIAYADYVHGATFAISTLDLRSGRRRYVATAIDELFDLTGGFSPDDRSILIRRWHRIFVVDLATSDSTLVGRDVGATTPAWFDDGRVAYLDRSGREWIVRPGGRSERTGLRIPADKTATWSPDGRYVLYTAKRAIWLWNRHAQTRRLISRQPSLPASQPGAWSPDSRHFLTCGCSYTSPPIAVYDLAGRKLGEVGGWGASWSPDGRYFVAWGGVTGSAVAYLQGLSVFSLRRHAAAELVGDRVAGVAYAGPGGWIVYPRYMTKTLQPEQDGGAPVETRLFAGRLSERWR
jgi:Tol biopolymer transport system component